MEQIFYVYPNVIIDMLDNREVTDSFLLSNDVYKKCYLREMDLINDGYTIHERSGQIRSFIFNIITDCNKK